MRAVVFILLLVALVEVSKNIKHLSKMCRNPKEDRSLTTVSLSMLTFTTKIPQKRKTKFTEN